MEGTSPPQGGIEVPRLKFDHQSDERGSHGQDYSGWPGFGKADYPSARDRRGRARGAAQGGAAGAVAGVAGAIAALRGGDGSVLRCASLGARVQATWARAAAHGGGVRAAVSQE